MKKSLFAMAAIVAAVGFSSVGMASAEPAAPSAMPACPAPSAAPYPFTCVQEPDGMTMRICADGKGCVEQVYDKTGNLLCQKTFKPEGVNASYATYHTVCDMEKQLVSAIPFPLPVGTMLPPFKG